MEELYRLSELRKILKISYPTILGYVHSGKLKAVRVGSQWRVPQSEFEKFLEKNDIVAHPLEKKTEEIKTE